MANFWDIDELPADILQTVRSETPWGPLSFSIRGSEASGYVFERRHRHPRGHLSIQRVPADKQALLHHFVDSDRLLIARQSVHQALLDFNVNFPDSDAAGARPEHRSGDETGLLRNLVNLCNQAGVAVCVYHVLLLGRSRKSIEIHDILIAGAAAGAAAWAQHHAHAAGFQSDPAIVRAMDNQLTPIGLTDVIARRPEHWLNRLPLLSGFQSNVLFPVRHRNAIGVLHVGSVDGRVGVERDILDKRPILQAIAHDVLLEYTAYRYRAWKTKLHLSPAAEQLIDRHRDGLKAADLEKALGLTNRAYRKLCREINSKVGFGDLRSNLALMEDWAGYKGA